MEIICIGSNVLWVALLIYIACTNWQIKSMKRQLKQRMQKKSQEMISLEWQCAGLKRLTVILNETLQQEGALRTSQEVQERELKELIINISHDLRTPLTVMKGYLQLLRQRQIDEEGREYLEICFRHTDDLEQRIRQFFEYSYWADQEEDLDLRTVNVTNLVVDTMTDFIPVFEEKGISMRLQRDTVCHGMGEPELLKRVMQNILRNCLQYANGETLISIEKIKDATMRHNGRIRVCVENPVADDCDLDADKVFQRFYTSHGERKRSAGLGLSIVKLLVEKMQGEVFAGKEGGFFWVGFDLPAGFRQGNHHSENVGIQNIFT